MSNLPQNWAETTLGDLSEYITSGSRDWSKYYANEGALFIRTQDINKNKLSEIDGIARVKLPNTVEGKRTLVKTYDLLVTITGANVGKCALIKDSLPEAYVSQSVALIRLIDKSLASFLHRQLLAPDPKGENFNTWLEENAYGMGRPVLSLENMRSVPIKLPPQAEQKRIADKLDALLARVDACRDRLDRIPVILKRFRQAVLDAAISGELTEEWRIFNPLPKGKALDDLCASELGRSGALRVRGEAARVEEQYIFELPSPWAWVANHRLTVDDSNAICAGPFGTIFKAKDFRESGVPIIFLRHVGEGRYLTHKPGFMDAAIWEKLHQPYTVFGGELLVTKLGDPPGTACIYPNGIGHAMVTPDVMKMSVDRSIALTEYLMYFFNSPASKKITESLCFGVTRLRIDLSMFKTFPIPLPPILEQREIVRRVESLFAYADRLEARYNAARTQVEKLTPALLAKAFRGELVSQDSNDEPASELLARIAASKTAVQPKKRAGKRLSNNS